MQMGANCKILRNGPQFQDALCMLQLRRWRVCPKSHLRQAITKTYRVGLVGKNACGSGYWFDVYTHMEIYSAFIYREETASIEL